MSADGEPLVNILTPVYNGAAYLRPCIESVIAQTYQNWTYTIINNRSKDETLAIAQEYAARDPRVRVITNENFVPMVENHNIGMSTVAPEAAYVKPLMADDWLFPDCVARMVAAAQAQPSVGMVCCYAFDGVEVLWTGFPYPAECVPGREAARRALLGGPYFFGTPSSMLFRADLVRKRRQFYNTFNLHSDQESGLDVLRESDFAFVHQVLTFNRVHEESQSSAVQHLDSMLVGNVYAVHKYGRDHLTAQEFEVRSAEMLDRYYSVLALGALQLRKQKYWDYHKQKLALMGRKLEKGRLVRAALRRGFAYLASPRDIYLIIREHSAKRRARRQLGANT